MHQQLSRANVSQERINLHAVYRVTWFSEIFIFRFLGEVWFMWRSVADVFFFPLLARLDDTNTLAGVFYAQRGSY